jgi:hypothetical protein
MIFFAAEIKASAKRAEHIELIPRPSTEEPFCPFNACFDDDGHAAVIYINMLIGRRRRQSSPHRIWTNCPGMAISAKHPPQVSMSRLLSVSRMFSRTVVRHCLDINIP